MSANHQLTYLAAIVLATFAHSRLIFAICTTDQITDAYIEAVADLPRASRLALAPSLSKEQKQLLKLNTELFEKIDEQEIVSLISSDGKVRSGVFVRNAKGVDIDSNGNIMLSTQNGSFVSVPATQSLVIVPRRTPVPGLEAIMPEHLVHLTSTSGKTYRGRILGTGTSGNIKFLLEGENTPVTLRKSHFDFGAPDTLRLTNLHEIPSKASVVKPAKPSGQVVAKGTAAQPKIRLLDRLLGRDPAAAAAQAKIKIQNIFKNDPSHTAVSGKTLHKIVAHPDHRNKVLIQYADADRIVAVKTGKLFENVSPASLPKGKTYTWVITDQGETVFGMVENSWEYGVKHIHLANGRKIVAAGELLVDKAGDYVFNLESGTFTLKLIRDSQVKIRDLERKVESVFSSEFGKPGKYTPKSLMVQAAPTADYVKGLCKLQEFLKLNSRLCGAKK